MEEIQIYLSSKKRDFASGVHLLVSHKKNLDAKKKAFYENETKKENVSALAEQMLVSDLRNYLRIENQEHKKKADNEQSEINTLIKMPTPDELKPPKQEPQNTEIIEKILEEFDNLIPQTPTPEAENIENKQPKPKIKKARRRK